MEVIVLGLGLSNGRAGRHDEGWGDVVMRRKVGFGLGQGLGFGRDWDLCIVECWTGISTAEALGGVSV